MSAWCGSGTHSVPSLIAIKNNIIRDGRRSQFEETSSSTYDHNGASQVGGTITTCAKNQLRHKIYSKMMHTYNVN